MCLIPRNLIILLLNLAVVTSGRKSVAPKDNYSPDGLRWIDLKVESKAGQILLASSEGFIPNGKVVGIIGPSGAGKSTLLAALSGSTPKGYKKVSGNVLFIGSNGTTSISRDVKDVALLRQHDLFFNLLTPRETMNFATFLQLDLNPKEHQKIVDTTLDKLGLRHVENMTIGHATHHHGCLSGGERRRLSVALELVSNPKVFIADEPTSGLDSAQAQKAFMAIINAARERQIPCICSLHQPRASIWKELDYFILMAPGGRIVYQGERECSIHYFSELGYDCPNETTPAEFFIDLVTIDSEDEDQGNLDRERVDFLVSAYRKHSRKPAENGVSVDTAVHSHTSIDPYSIRRHHRHRRFPSRIGALLLRSLRQNLRDVRVNLLRTTAAIGLARLFAELFSGTKKGVSNAKSVADRTALLSYGVINMTMMAMMKTINLFGREKEVVQRERMRKQYTSLDYLLSKSMAELPLDMFFSSIFAFALKSFTGISTPLMQLIGTFSSLTVASASLGFAVGSFTSNVDEAMTLGFPIMTVLMAVGVINPSGVDESVQKPFILKLLKKFSPVASAIEALCISEFKGMCFEKEGQSKSWNLRELPRMGALALVRNGDDVLRALGLSKKTFHECIHELGIMSLISLASSWIGLLLSGADIQNNYEKNDGQFESNNVTVATSRSTNFVINVPGLKLV